MMRSLLVSTFLIAAAAAPAMAQEVVVTGNVSLVNDYQWRNVTQSNFDTVVQGGLDLTAGGFYVGTWASGVDFGDPSDVNTEVDLYGGYRFDLAGIGADIGAIYYAYPDSEDTDINFVEVYGKLSKSFGPFTAAGSVNYDPDNENLYVDATGSLLLGDTLTLSANVGQWVEGLGEYTGYNVGASWTVLGATLGVRWYDNDIGGDQDNIVFSIGRTG